MARKYLVFAILFTITTTSVFGQPGVFNTQYDFANEQSRVISHVQTWDKGSVLLCESKDSVSGFTTIVKIDSLGNELWQYRFGQEDYIESKIVVSADSGVLVAFTDRTNQSVKNIYHLLKLDANGNEVYSRLYTFPTRFQTNLSGVGILPRNSGGCYLLSTVIDSIGNKSRWNLVSIDTAGNVVWSNCYDTTGVHLNENCLDTCLNGDIMIAGTGIEQPSGNRVAVIARVAPNGNFQWSKYYQSNYYDLNVRSLTNLSGDTFYITSMTTIPFTTYPSVSVIQITGGGAIIWSHRFSASGISLDTREGQTVENDKLIFLTYGLDSVQHYVSCFGKVGTNGLLESTRMYKSFEGNSIDTCGNRNYSITGSAGLYYSTARYMSIDSAGNSCMDTTLNAIGYVLPLSVTFGMGTMPFPLTASNDSLVHPAVNLIASVACGPNDIEEISEQVFNIYPVPAIEYIEIRSAENISRVDIYNFAGELMYSADVHSDYVQIGISAFPAGIYLVRIAGESGESAKTIIVQ